MKTRNAGDISTLKKKRVAHAAHTLESQSIMLMPAIASSVSVLILIYCEFQMDQMIISLAFPLHVKIYNNLLL